MSCELLITLQLNGYVPTEFLKGVITPIVKDAEGDTNSLDNYRGITLSHTFSFLFEHAILSKTVACLSSDDLQFGYKKRHSTSHAIYVVKQCIDFFCQHGSYVYASFLDCTKGFDRVCHKGLFLKLIAGCLFVFYAFSRIGMQICQVLSNGRTSIVFPLKSSRASVKGVS